MATCCQSVVTCLRLSSVYLLALPGLHHGWWACRDVVPRYAKAKFGLIECMNMYLTNKLFMWGPLIRSNLVLYDWPSFQCCWESLQARQVLYHLVWVNGNASLLLAGSQCVAWSSSHPPMLCPCRAKVIGECNENRWKSEHASWFFNHKVCRDQRITRKGLWQGRWRIHLNWQHASRQRLPLTSTIWQKFPSNAQTLQILCASVGTASWQCSDWSVSGINPLLNFLCKLVAGSEKDCATWAESILEVWSQDLVCHLNSRFEHVTPHEHEFSLFHATGLQCP